jgi:hypothetical protein
VGIPYVQINESIDWYRLESLDNKNSKRLFKSYFSPGNVNNENSNKEKSINQILSHLYGHSKLIRIAASLAKINYSHDLEDFCRILEKNGPRGIENIPKKIEHKIDYFYNWQMDNGILSTQHIDVLQTLSLLPEDTYYWENPLLNSWLKEMDIINSLNVLKEYAWIDDIGDGRGIKAHSLVRELVLSSPEMQNRHKDDFKLDKFKPLLIVMGVDYAEAPFLGQQYIAEGLINEIGISYDINYIKIIKSLLGYCITKRIISPIRFDDGERILGLKDIASNVLDYFDRSDQEMSTKLILMNTRCALGYYLIHCYNGNIGISLEGYEKHLTKAKEEVESCVFGKIIDQDVSSITNQLYELKSRILSNIGAWHLRLANVDRSNYLNEVQIAQKFHEEAMEIRKQLKDVGFEPHGLRNSYRQLGTDCFKLRSFEKALFYHKKAVGEILENLVVPRNLHSTLLDLANYYNNIGGCYLGLYDANNTEKEHLENAIETLLVSRLLHMPYCTERHKNSFKHCDYYKRRNESLREINNLHKKIYQNEEHINEDIKKLIEAFKDYMINENDKHRLYKIMSCKENSYYNITQYNNNDKKLKEAFEHWDRKE